MRVSLSAYWQLLRRYLQPQRGAVGVMGGLLLGSIGLQLVGPQVARAFIDGTRRGADEGALVRLALLFLGVAAAQQVLTVLAAYCSERVAWTATNALRGDLAAHLLRLDPGFHTARTPGELIERVDGDVNALAGFFSSFVVQVLGSVLLLGGVLVSVAVLDLRLGAAFSLFAVLALVGLSWVRGFGTGPWQADRQHSAVFYGYLGEVLTATEDLRSSGAEAYALRRFLAHLRGWWPVRRQAGLWGQAVLMAAIAAFAVADALAYGLGGGLYRLGALSLGAVYMVVAYTAMLAHPIETIRTQLQDLQHADAGIARVRELLQTRSTLREGTESVPRGPLAVEFHNVCFSYERGAEGLAEERSEEGLAEERSEDGQRAWALEDLSFTLGAGRTLGIVGRTGSGKTTVARLLFRLYDPQKGAVRLDGLDLRRASLGELRARVGLVTQEVQLFAASLRDNITFFDPTVPDERLHAVLQALGLEAWVQRLPRGLETPISGTMLSAGEAQLLALARVFVKDPGLIILDEASSRLDPATEALLDRALGTLLEKRTAIVIAHRLTTVERVDDLLVLEDGRLVEQGPRDDLARDPTSRFAALRRTGLEEALL